MSVEESAQATLTSLRLQLRANGYSPLPAYQKKLLLQNWTTKGAASEEEIACWEQNYPAWTNTGALTQKMPVLDIDIKDPEAADRIDELVTEALGELGVIVRRFGDSPKRCIFCKNDGPPFGKIVIVLEHPSHTGSDGKPLKQRIEVLGAGQQVIMAGLHPDTKRPYGYHGNRSLLDVPRSELPPVTRDLMQDLVNRAVEILIKEFDYREPEPDDSTVVPWPTASFDAESALAAMTSGAEVNDVQPRVA